MFAASSIGERAEHGKRRHGAYAAVRAELTAYRDTLHYDLESRDARPKTYASIESQERLATTVLRELEHLRRRPARRLRQELERLVGPATVATAEAALHVPADLRDADREARRVDLIEHRLRADPEEAATRGQLGLVRRSPNETQHREHHAAAMSTLQRMLDISTS